MVSKPAQKIQHGQCLDRSTKFKKGKISKSEEIVFGQQLV